MTFSGTKTRIKAVFWPLFIFALCQILGLSAAGEAVGNNGHICLSSLELQCYPYDEDSGELGCGHCVFNCSIPFEVKNWYRCDKEINTPPSDGVKAYQCGSNSHVYGYERNGDAGRSKAPAPGTSMHDGCSIIWFPPPQQRGIQLHYHLTGHCAACIAEDKECKGQWQDDLNGSSNFKCKKEKRHLRLILSLGSICIVLALYAAWCRYKYRFSLQPKRLDSTKPDLEDGGVCYGFPMIFNYSELSEATDNFDSSRVLGDGGFGIVYHGKLRDGREVAVKRLYERNYNQVQQFKNEVDILACLRHPNLVILYGCTSRHSRELLLIYEYIPDGTVADHLHASDILHHDVKTNNILLDNNFCVKVADFGLSRLFPMDVSHISTAPQGTPVYLDPEYQKCYQLTEKSDVYSFGVVLVELISSLPAIDIFRPAGKINLSDYALTRIESRAFHELIDPELGFESDFKVRRMTIQVAELAFQCLQQKKEFRPSMNVVLETLENINNADYEEAETEEMDKNGKPENEESVLSLSEDHSEAALLKNNQSNSPNSVMANFVSRSYTSSTSI